MLTKTKTPDAVTKTHDRSFAAARTAVASGGTLFTGNTKSGDPFAFTD